MCISPYYTSLKIKFVLIFLIVQKNELKLFLIYYLKSFANNSVYYDIDLIINYNKSMKLFHSNLKVITLYVM